MSWCGGRGSAWGGRRVLTLERGTKMTSSSPSISITSGGEMIYQIKFCVGCFLVGHLSPVNFRSWRLCRGIIWCIPLQSINHQPRHFSWDVLVHRSRGRIQSVTAAVFVIIPFKRFFAMIHKMRLEDTPLFSASVFTWAMIESRAGSLVNRHRLRISPVTRLKKLFVPWIIPVGPRQIAGIPRLFMQFVTGKLS